LITCVVTMHVSTHFTLMPSRIEKICAVGFGRACHVAITTNSSSKDGVRAGSLASFTSGGYAQNVLANANASIGSNGGCS
jgi:hypothetical protein